jgi:tetratricopeptide (TPR) repeat protein
MKRILAIAAVLLAFAPLEAAAQAQDLARRLKALEPGKWADWLATAAELEREAKEKPVAAARHLCEAVARAGDEESSRQALLRLADLHLGKTACTDDVAAAGLLMELARRTGSEEILVRIEKMRAEAIHYKKVLLESATRYAREKNYAQAEDCLRRALAVPYDITPEVGERVTEATLFARLAELAAEQDKACRARWEGKDPVCPVCEGKSVSKCAACDGRGKVRRTQEGIPGPDGRPTPPQTVWHTCDRCEGWGCLRCAPCQATGYNLAVLEPGDARTFAEFSKLAGQCIRKDDLEDSLATAQDWMLKLGLDLPPIVKPGDETVWSLFPIRGRSRIPQSFESLWDAPKANVDRMNLVIDYGVVTSLAVSPYRPMLSLSRTARVERNLRPAWFSAAPLSPERVGAFAAFARDRWCASVGTWRGRRDLAELRQAEALEIAGGAPHGVVFIAWKEGAQKEAKALASQASFLSPLSGFSHSYPFLDLQQRLSAFQNGDPVEVLGRFQSREGRWPRMIFEVWWIGTPGAGPTGGGDPEEGKEPEGPRPSPGPLLDDKEEHVLRTNERDRVIAIGNGHFRQALDREAKAPSWADFRAENEKTITSLQKARACYEKAYAKEAEPGLAHLIHLVNLRIQARIEAARAR